MSERRHSTASFAVDTMEKVLLLKAVPLFAGLNAVQLVPVTEILTEVAYEEGDRIFEEGDEGHHLYIVVRGEVEVVIDGNVVATLGDQDCFGEMAVLERSVRSATIRASTDVLVQAIAREDFQDLFDLYPGLSRGIIKVLVDRLRSVTAG